MRNKTMVHENCLVDKILDSVSGSDRSMPQFVIYKIKPPPLLSLRMVPRG